MPAATVLVLLIVALVFVSWKLFNSLRAMEIRKHPGVVVSRYESPTLFWIVIVMQCSAIGVLLAIILSFMFGHGL